MYVPSCEQVSELIIRNNLAKVPKGGNAIFIDAFTTIPNLDVVLMKTFVSPDRSKCPVALKNESDRFFKVWLCHKLSVYIPLPF